MTTIFIIIVIVVLVTILIWLRIENNNKDKTIARLSNELSDKIKDYDLDKEDYQNIIDTMNILHKQREDTNKLLNKFKEQTDNDIQTHTGTD